MTEYVKAFIVKLLIFGVLTFSIFGIFTNASIMKLLLISLVVSAATFIGDVFILPRMNQALAIVGDFAGILLLYWLIGGLVVDDVYFRLLQRLPRLTSEQWQKQFIIFMRWIDCMSQILAHPYQFDIRQSLLRRKKWMIPKRITMRTVPDSTVMANNIIINKYISCLNSI